MPIWIPVISINLEDNGTEFFGATLPPIFTQIPGGLFINTVNRCLNHTSFQCIDTSGEGLQGEVSDIGFLTVTSPSAIPCTGEYSYVYYAWLIDIDLSVEKGVP